MPVCPRERGPRPRAFEAVEGPLVSGPWWTSQGDVLCDLDTGSSSFAEVGSSSTFENLVVVGGAAPAALHFDREFGDVLPLEVSLSYVTFADLETETVVGARLKDGSLAVDHAVFADTTGFAIIAVDAAFASADTVLLWNAGAPDLSVAVSNLVEADPRFVSYTADQSCGNDLRLAADSPVPDSGAYAGPDAAGWNDDDGDGAAAWVDCDDLDPAVAPGADEQCNGTDDDCDGQVDDADPTIDPALQTLYYPDADGDGHGDLHHPGTGYCVPAVGWALVGDDCDPQAADVFPGAPERCDGFDQDCDGAIDEDLTFEGVAFADDDGDGFGGAAVQATGCAQPPGTITVGGDCDDANAEVWPGAAAVPDDGLDQDCDGADAESSVADTGDPAAEAPARDAASEKGGCNTTRAPQGALLPALALWAVAHRSATHRRRRDAAHAPAPTPRPDRGVR